MCCVATVLLIKHVFYFCMFHILNRAVPKSRDNCYSTSRDDIENDEGCLPFKAMFVIPMSPFKVPEIPFLHGSSAAKRLESPTFS